MSVGASVNSPLPWKGSRSPWRWQIVLPRHEAQGTARKATHERLAHAADDLSVNF